MKQMCRIILPVLACVSCSAVQGQTPATLESKVVELARTMKTVTPIAMGPMTLADVEAAGRVIVLKIDGLESWRPAVPDEVAARMLGAQICDGGGVRALVAEGAQVRIDATTPAGEQLAPLIVCGA